MAVVFLVWCKVTAFQAFLQEKIHLFRFLEAKIAHLFRFLEAEIIHLFRFWGFFVRALDSYFRSALAGNAPRACNLLILRKLYTFTAKNII